MLRDWLRPRRAPPVPLWEWVVAGIGLAVLLGSIGYLVADLVAGNGQPPEIRVQLDRIERSGDGWLALVRVENRGGRTAARVRVEGVLDEGAAAERSEIELDYVAPGTEQRGGLLFTRDPANGLRLRALGWVEP